MMSVTTHRRPCWPSLAHALQMNLFTDMATPLTGDDEPVTEENPGNDPVVQQCADGYKSISVKASRGRVSPMLTTMCHS